MKKTFITFSLVVITGMFAGLFCPTGSSAEVNVSVGISVPLPIYRFGAPPEVILIPGTYAYFVPAIDLDIFFYQGYWYRPHHGRWYRAKSYNGPWVFLSAARIPRVLISLPPDYRTITVYERIPYGHLKKHWRTWERERYWDRKTLRHEERGLRREQRERRRDLREELRDRRERDHR